jgi:hypothetical protein
MTTTKHREPITTCLDCRVLPPFTIVLCALHAQGVAMRALCEVLVADVDPFTLDEARDEARRIVRALEAQA